MYDSVQLFVVFGAFVRGLSERPLTNGILQKGKCKMTFSLKKEEKLFCYRFAETGDISEAARLSGISGGDAYEKGCEILSKPQARKLISKHREFVSGQAVSDIKTALRRIAFSKPNDAVTVAMKERFDEENADLFAVSEIKKIEGKGVEIKLAGKVEALRLLYEIEKNDFDRKKSDSFISALKGTVCPDLDDDE